jgi:branched-chain amino acid transport system permease protein
MVGAFVALITFMIITSFVGVAAGGVFLALVVCLIVTVIVTSLYNWTIERVAYRKLRGSFRLAPLISAIGMSILLVNFVQISQDARNKPVRSIIDGGLTVMKGERFDVVVAYKDLLIMAVTAVLLLVFWYLVQKTPLGRAQRACEQDRKMAALLGINVDRTVSITFVIGAGLAAVASVMWLVKYNVVSYNDGFIPGVKAFTAAVLGGIGSLPGAVIGGLLIGIIESLWSGYFSIDYKDVAAFTILVIALIFMPQGLLGKPEVEKV